MERLADDSLRAERVQLGAILGLDGPAPERVLYAALADSTYAQHLLTCRRHPELLQHMLDNPPPPRQPERPDTASLLRNAADAFARWAKAGFTTVDDAVRRRRLDACLACPHLRAAPAERRLLYAVLGAGSAPRAVCNLCGCVVAHKTRMTSETCPDEHPDDAKSSRWGEPRSR